MKNKIIYLVLFISLVAIFIFSINSYRPANLIVKSISQQEYNRGTDFVINDVFYFWNFFYVIAFLSFLVGLWFLFEKQRNLIILFSLFSAIYVLISIFPMDDQNINRKALAIQDINTSNKKDNTLNIDAQVNNLFVIGKREKIIFNYENSEIIDYIEFRNSFINNFMNAKHYKKATFTNINFGNVINSNNITHTKINNYICFDNEDLRSFKKQVLTFYLSNNIIDQTNLFISIDNKQCVNRYENYDSMKLFELYESGIKVHNVQ